MKKIGYLIALTLLLSLCACGFHLRKHEIHLGAKYPTVILPYTGSHTFHQALRHALITSSIHVIEQATNNTMVPQLTVVSQELTQQPLVYGPDSELRRERLKMRVVFSFGEVAPKQFELSAIRERQLMSSQHLGDNAEKVLIEQEMQADIIHQLLRYMDLKNF